MEIEHLSIIGHFVVPRIKNGKTFTSLMESEEILKFALIHHGFCVQELEYKPETDILINNNTDVFSVRIDIVSEENKPLTLESLHQFFKEYDIRFIGNLFMDSSV